MDYMEKGVLFFQDHPTLCAVGFALGLSVILQFFDFIKETFFQGAVPATPEDLFQETVNALGSLRIKTLDPVEGRIVLDQRISFIPASQFMSWRARPLYTKNAAIQFSRNPDGTTQVKIHGPISFFGALWPADSLSKEELLAMLAPVFKKSSAIRPR